MPAGHQQVAGRCRGGTGHHDPTRADPVGETATAEQAGQQSDRVDPEGRVDEHARQVLLGPQHRQHRGEMVRGPARAEQQQRHRREDPIGRCDRRAGGGTGDGTSSGGGTGLRTHDSTFHLWDPS
ncbi:hypothetical protein SDC9_94862 [bioreactor metagenome]|uniref:Uncharacterized protein n=1 Tax=bioreactor metagenome TaxID=1076179 RepID=A0A645A4L9_9ZZZZ